MKKFHIAFAVAGILILLACAKQPQTTASMSDGPDRTPAASRKNPGIVYGGGNGFSMETAVAILHAKGETDGVRAEYHWISVHYPNWKVRSQALLQEKHGFYDKIVCVKPDGKTVGIFFDISEFFGKW